MLRNKKMTEKTTHLNDQSKNKLLINTHMVIKIGPILLCLMACCCCCCYNHLSLKPQTVETHLLLHSWLYWSFYVCHHPLYNLALSLDNISCLSLILPWFHTNVTYVIIQQISLRNSTLCAWIYDWFKMYL